MLVYICQLNWLVAWTTFWLISHEEILKGSFKMFFLKKGFNLWIVPNWNENNKNSKRHQNCLQYNLMADCNNFTFWWIDGYSYKLVWSHLYIFARSVCAPQTVQFRPLLSLKNTFLYKSHCTNSYVAPRYKIVLSLDWVNVCGCFYFVLIEINLKAQHIQ